MAAFAPKAAEIMMRHDLTATVVTTGGSGNTYRVSAMPGICPGGWPAGGRVP